MAKRLRQEIIGDSRQRLEFPALLEVLSAYSTCRPGKAAITKLEPLAADAARGILAETEEVRLLRREAGNALRLDGLIDVPELLAEDGPVASRVLSPEELAGVRHLLDRNRSLGDLLRRWKDGPRLQSRGDALVDPVTLREALEHSLDAQGNVLSSASTELESLRRRIEVEERQLRDWMEKRRQAPNLRKALQGDVVSVRNGRFVFAVRAEHRGQVKGLVHGESASGATLFVEPQEIVLRGDELAAMHQRELREVARILAQLTTEVRGQRELLLRNYRSLLELDGLVARARFADAFRATPATLVDDRRLELRDARHPLLMWRERDAARGFDDIDLGKVLEAIVPLDLEMGQSFHQLVVTGPNTGGKTVVLKVVGLLVLMSFCGIPIPAAAGSKIPSFDAVLADIGDEQSLEQNLSTFSSHMTVISRLLSAVSSRSLVLIDELGAGTDPLEGAALGESILERLYERGAFTLVTTHLGRLKELAFRRRKCQNASMEFDPEALAPTYHLLMGVPGRSNALIIARRIGVPEEVIARAEEVLEGDERIDAEVLEGMERTRRDLERRRGEMERARRGAAELEASKAEEVEAVRSMRASIEHEAERAEEARVMAVVDAVTDALKKVGEPPRERRQAFEELLLLLEDARQSTRLAERRRRVARELRKGDPVFVPRFRAITEVRKINKSKEIITVSLGGIPTEVKFTDISWVLPPPGYELTWFEE